jgi:peptidoglycan/xylan/chitin deacetylase (PgdA/CDA1 family)
MKNGKFVLSLDFELHWGGVELWDLEQRKDYFATTRIGIPKIIALFQKYDIHCTWATVGLLFAKDLAQLKSYIPELKPSYTNKSLFYYYLIEQNEIGTNELDDPFHYGFSLINTILESKNQELASHTFCHYYCNEEGQNVNQFEADIQAAQKIAMANFNVELKSLVFPRNQFNKDYLEVAKNQGIKVFRSNPNVWFWNTNFGKITSLFRALDTLLPISKSLTYKESDIVYKNGIVELPASRFFRPYVAKEKFIRKIKLNRILNEMTFAAKRNRIYHLWWHPHNFGDALAENLEDLATIVSHYKHLNAKYGFESKSMKDFIK